MEVTIKENYVLMLEEVFNPIELKSGSGDVISICMRDSGFEFTYHGIVYEAKNGIINALK